MSFHVTKQEEGSLRVASNDKDSYADSRKFITDSFDRGQISEWEI